MALGLHVFRVTTEQFLNRLHEFDSVRLNEAGEFACWQEGTCNFFIVEDVPDLELRNFSFWIMEKHEQLRAERVCEKCGSSNTIRSEHSSKAYGDREIKGVLQQVEITEYWIDYKCGDCQHVRTVGL